MRLFVAVNFTDEMKDALVECQKKLIYGHENERINPTVRENLHMTLAFIGEYQEPERVKKALGTLEWEQFTISPGKLGRFGDLYWLGIENGREAEKLSSKVRALLSGNGIPFDTKPMKPHITLVRELKLDKIPGIPPAKVGMIVNRVSLMKSERIKGRMVYTEIWSKNI